MTVFIVVGCSSQPVAKVNNSRADLIRKSGVHVVQHGETLFSISRQYGISVEKLAEINGLKPPYTLYPSQKLTLGSAVRGQKNSVPGNATQPSSSSMAKTSQSGSKSTDSYVARSNNRTSSSSGTQNNQNFSSTPKWQWPSSGKIIAPFGGETAVNKGIDLSGKLGEPVLAAAAGQVVYAGGGLRGYGKLLIIKHNETFLSAYAHNNNLLVKEGDFVKAGQRIADMGSSGTDRVKLHFEIRSEGNPVDPLQYLPKR